MKGTNVRAYNEEFEAKEFASLDAALTHAKDDTTVLFITYEADGKRACLVRAESNDYQCGLNEPSGRCQKEVALSPCKLFARNVCEEHSKTEAVFEDWMTQLIEDKQFPATTPCIRDVVVEECKSCGAKKWKQYGWRRPNPYDASDCVDCKAEYRGE